jgi:protein-glutamine gamma-glutamyltransferase
MKTVPLFSNYTYSILASRILLFLIVTYCITQLVEPNTSAITLSLATIAGIFFGTSLTATSLTHLGFSVVAASLVAIAYIISSVLMLLDAPLSNGTFYLFRFSEHFNLSAVIFITLACSTWGFFRSKIWVFIETILLLVCTAELLAPHRNLRFDSPQWVADMAWNFGVSQLSGLIGVGILILIGTVSYLGLAGAVYSEKSLPSFATGLRKSLGFHILAFGIFALVIFFISQQVHKHFTEYAEDRLTNGVGKNSGKNKPPLSFYSALGGSSEPAALLRLEGDYSENPFQPMLYLRENALSKIESNTLIAGEEDSTIPGKPPTSHFTAKEDPSLIERKPLTHSVYLISKHDLLFAADYPTSIKPLKIPGNGRFVGAFRATSLVPAYPKERLEYSDVGNPDWSEETLKHYLTTHPDERYSQLAKKIAGNQITGVQKALAVQEYLNKNATYTLTPNHKVDADTDPVAPFLFGDLRGYCVHFAHATVYMLRSLGIPSRIATGYLTDLSQSRDGHTLLRMSDRHAWAEVYIAQRGWVPFDTMPEKVESHANSEMNVELLEELMGMLEPGEDVLPDSLIEDEPNLAPPRNITAADIAKLLALGGLVAFLLALLKTYLLFGHLLTSSSAKSLKRGYRGLVTRLHDLGITRRKGETRLQFGVRAKEILGRGTLDTTLPLLELAYQKGVKFERTDVKNGIQNDISQYRTLNFWLKLKGLMNPASVIAFLGGKKW